MRRKMKIDFNTKKTEADWQRVFDDFCIKATPKWFEWLGWVLILGALTFLTELTQNTILSITSWFSYFALFLYLQSFFFSLDFHGLPFVKSEKIRRLMSLLISGILALCVWLFLIKLVSEISGKI